ncbi:MAG: sensor histidine kinase, partial [Deltaproteobacteria bacterium]|nr:sensor histidine kinase [Deltaproteobacteria bacterium]MBW2129983.1 sensor histidine kinase [Deltaproteobacteria bacterium]
IDLLADKRRFASLTVILFLVYTVSFLVFDRLVANEQRYFLFAFGLVVSSLFFSWLLGGKATFVYVAFFNLLFTFIYSKPLFPAGTLYPMLFLSRSFIIISVSFALLMAFMIFFKSPADEARERMALETKEEREKARLLEFLVTERKITQDVVAQSNYAKDELLFLQGAWRSNIHNILNDLPEDRENEIYREIIEPFQEAILRHLKGLEKKLTFNPDHMKVKKLVEAVEEELSGELAAISRKYEVHFQVVKSDGILERRVFCDPYKVVEIIRNLVKNAQKAVELRQITLMREDFSAYRNFKPYLGIDLRAERGELLLVITDNGGGLKEEYLDKVFREPIPSSKRATYGLGTTFVKFFSDRMGFQVRGDNAVTEHGKGFRVTIRIPLAE